MSTFEFDKEKLMNTPPEKLHELYDDYFKVMMVRNECPVSTSSKAVLWVQEHAIGTSVLEVGSGFGGLMYGVWRSFGRYIFSDFSFEVCHFNRIRGDAVCCDGHYLPFKDNFFDVIICSHTLEHVVSPVDVLREMIRVSNNRVIVVVPDYISSDKSADYHFHNFPDIRSLDRVVDAVCPFFSVKYKHLTESGEICCCIEVGVSREQKIAIRQ